MNKLLIYGTGLIAEVAYFYFTHDTDYEIIGFTNASAFIKEPKFNNLEVTPFENIEQHHPPGECEIFVAIGYAKTNQIREQRYLEAREKGYKFATYVSPRATYYDTPVGGNCFILENNVIQPFVTIGNDVTLWSGNHIGHHSIIKDHCFISSHVVVSGSCVIGENCFLGVNSTLRDGIKIGKLSVVGAGTTVMKDCEERSLVIPADSTYKIVDRDLI
jgi:sugar O-acyltransferase (sialic acid O-acetyltransferase NeuD family)